MQYEGEVVERNEGQTFCVLRSLMEEYDLRLVIEPLLAKKINIFWTKYKHITKTSDRYTKTSWGWTGPSSAPTGSELYIA